VHGAAGQAEALPRVDGVPARDEHHAGRAGGAVQRDHGGRRPAGRRRRAAGRVLLRRQREELLAAVPSGARLRQPFPLRVRRAGQRAEHRGADAQGPGRLADQPDPPRAGRRRSGANGRVRAVHVLHVPDHLQEGGVLARGRRVRAAAHVRLAGAAHRVHSAHARPGHVEIRRRQVSRSRFLYVTLKYKNKKNSVRE